MADRLGPLLRLFVALKVNKVWPRAACVILYGWRGGQARWEDGELWREGFAAGVADADRPHLTPDEMDRFIADGDVYTEGYRAGLHEATRPA